MLITGSEGLIGTALCSDLETRGVATTGLDIRGHGKAYGDVRNVKSVLKAVSGCAGIVHLAAVSRVVWGERDPEGCWATNVLGTRNLIDAAKAQERPPWLLFASSREVYGQADMQPVHEAAELRPMNIYGRSKAECERMIEQAQEDGLRAAVVRYSNVYGSTADHSDRVVPAFAKAAADGGSLRVDGSNHTFDFTHLNDTVRGTMLLIARLVEGVVPPPIHLLTGQPVTLAQLAELAQEFAHKPLTVVRGQPRDFDVATFYGCTERAEQILGWRATINIREGMNRLVKEFSRAR